MNLTNWIAIAAIMAALMNPFITDWLARKRAQELLDTATPATNQPSALIIRYLKRFFSGPWPGVLILILGVANSVYALIGQVNSTEPISRYSTFLISFHVATILFLFIALFVVAVGARMLRSDRYIFKSATSVHERVVRMLQDDRSFRDSVEQILKVAREKSKPKGFLD